MANARSEPQTTYDVFATIDMRVGRVIAAEPFPQAWKPALRLTIDFGELGEKRLSAQVAHYDPALLVGRLVIAVVNFPPRQIGPFVSEVLVLGVPDDSGRVVLLQPDADVRVGGRVF